MADLDFSIVTPSMNQLPWLRRCVASVADQAGPDHEHLVQDGGSTDGTTDWLAGQAGIAWQSGTDAGMYDALNRGFARAGGRICAYLNCDEQYLAGTLEWVAQYFAEHPGIDMLFGSALLVDPVGRLLAYRKAYPPRACYIAADHLYLLSCATFWRRKLLEEGMRFDASFRAAGDADFVVRALRAGYRAGWTSRYLAAFTVTGSNLGASRTAQGEHARIRSPAGSRRLDRSFLTLARRLEKLWAGAYRQAWPLQYELYLESCGRRQVIEAQSGGWSWPSA